jgi:hypothetical protein
MPKPSDPKFPNPVRVLLELQRGDEVHQPVAGKELDPALKLLRQWQSQRLARTYADLLASKRYAPACNFFLSDLYAARDFSQRDHDVKRLHSLLSRFLPASMLQILTDSITLNELTAALDHSLSEVLVGKLGVTDAITPELYAEGYRVCDNYVERLRQIQLIVKIGRQVDEAVRLPMVGTTLRLARGPAERAGWIELYEFLERGFTAFKHMHGAESFLRTIEDRETRILDRIFAGKADPFEIDGLLQIP